MYTYAVRHWGKQADVNVVNTAGYTPLTLAAKLGRKDIFEEMLELTKSEFWRFSDMTCSAYPLTALDTIRPNGTTSVQASKHCLIGAYEQVLFIDVFSRLGFSINDHYKWQHHWPFRHDWH